MQTRLAPTLLALFLAATLGLGSPVDRLYQGKNKSLRMVMDMVVDGGRPTAQDVINAYNEYVGLHRLQNELADGFGQQEADKKNADEQRYLEVGALLRRPELELIAQNLFNLLQEDYTLNEVTLSPKLDLKLTLAIRDLFV